VVGGNVQTSQRVTDVILKAFRYVSVDNIRFGYFYFEDVTWFIDSRACAASQGCMNNLTFGNSSMGYYETIAGGAGAGPTWHGCSAVHTHMTNTRITDPEILEKRYPVILRQFSVRRGSGGEGCYKGGDGIIRELEFTQVISYHLCLNKICNRDN
jgi:5-oxoprolinase (ATP-hydrolysing)